MHYPAMAHPAQPRQSVWWEDQPDIPGLPLSAPLQSFCDLAIDRLSLAFVAQQSARGDASITQHIVRWCLELREARGSLATCTIIRDALDHLDRQACEPQSWQHLRAAEEALESHIRTLRAQR
jgi:hypothetical protein